MGSKIKAFYGKFMKLNILAICLNRRKFNIYNYIQRICSNFAVLHKFLSVSKMFRFQILQVMTCKQNPKCLHLSATFHAFNYI